MRTCFFYLLAGIVLTSVNVSAQSYPIGHRTMNFTDPDRNDRPVPSEVYYPAISSGNNTTCAEGTFPFIVFGHGFLMTYNAYLYLKDALVPLGYIITYPTTEGGMSPNHAEYGADLAFLINKMKAEGEDPVSPFYQHIDSTSAVIGHSMGGGASFLACANNSVPTAMVTFAAAETNPSAIAAASHITIPSLVFAADEDCVTPPPQHQIPMYDSLASECKVYISIKGGGHCYFADYNFLCSFGEAGCQQNFTITREQQHSIVIDFLVPYLNYTLKNDASAWILFNDSLESSSRIDFEKLCTVTATEYYNTESEFFVFPNPASDILFVRITGCAGITVNLSIRSVIGNIILKKNIYPGFDTIDFKTDISSFPKGFYILELLGSEKYYYRFFLKN